MKNENELLYINDCYVDVVGISPAKKKLDSIYNLLPQDIKNDAEKWGWSDTVVREDVCFWIRNNFEKI